MDGAGSKAKREAGPAGCRCCCRYPFPGPFDYRVPPDCDPHPGDVVLVPLNRREELGVVWDAAGGP